MFPSISPAHAGRRRQSRLQRRSATRPYAPAHYRKKVRPKVQLARRGERAAKAQASTMGAVLQDQVGNGSEPMCRRSRRRGAGCSDTARPGCGSATRILGGRTARATVALHRPRALTLARIPRYQSARHRRRVRLLERYRFAKGRCSRELPSGQYKVHSIPASTGGIGNEVQSLSPGCRDQKWSQRRSVPRDALGDARDQQGFSGPGGGFFLGGGLGGVPAHRPAEHHPEDPGRSTARAGRRSTCQGPTRCSTRSD